MDGSFPHGEAEELAPGHVDDDNIELDSKDLAPVQLKQRKLKNEDAINKLPELDSLTKHNLILIFAVVVAPVLLISTSKIVHLSSQTKNLHVVCKTGKNESFKGKEQCGDAYKFSRDTCKELSK